MITYEIHGYNAPVTEAVKLGTGIRTAAGAAIEANLWLTRPWFQGYETVVIRSSEGKVVATLTADTPKRKGRKTKHGN